MEAVLLRIVQEALRLFATAQMELDGPKETYGEQAARRLSVAPDQRLGSEAFAAEVVETTKSYTPTIFDDLIHFLNVAVGMPRGGKGRRRAIYLLRMQWLIFHVDCHTNAQCPRIRFPKQSQWRPGMTKNDLFVCSPEISIPA